MTPLIVALLLAQNPFDAPYCKSFAAGWKSGWCAGNLECIAPPPPACPVQQAGTDAHEAGWLDGYERARRQKRKNNAS
jgi:hypothetical protein